MAEKKDTWRKVIFAIAIALLFIPMVYLGVNTFFPEVEENKCWDLARPTKLGEEDNRTQEEIDADNQKRETCQQEWQEKKNKNDAGKYVTLMIISIIASFLTLLSLDWSIKYGLFFGIVITAFSGTLAYMRAKSIVGFLLMVALFVVIIFFIQRERKK